MVAEFLIAGATIALVSSYRFARVLLGRQDREESERAPETPLEIDLLHVERRRAILERERREIETKYDWDAKGVKQTWLRSVDDRLSELAREERETRLRHAEKGR